MPACIRRGILSTSLSRHCLPRLSHSSRAIWRVSLRVVGHGGGTEIQELSMTCLAQAAQVLLLQWMTATYGFQLGGTLTAMPPCWIMLFVPPQDSVLRPKLCAIGCMMHNFTADVHGKVHLCNLDTMQHGTDGPNNILNGPLGIGITFSSPMSVAYAFKQTIVGFVFGVNLVRLNVFETVSIFFSFFFIEEPSSTPGLPRA